MSQFQSAPALCRAGDKAMLLYSGHVARFNPRPLFAERATQGQNRLHGHGKFQSAPALCRAGDRPSYPLAPIRACFNPRPLFAERATMRMPENPMHCSVSIRARSLQSGRRKMLATLVHVVPFQSAPALCRAGDLPTADAALDPIVFQSAPALCRAGDMIGAR